MNRDVALPGTKPDGAPAIAQPAMPVSRSRASLMESKKYLTGFFWLLRPMAFSVVAQAM